MKRTRRLSLRRHVEDLCENVCLAQQDDDNQQMSQQVTMASGQIGMPLLEKENGQAWK